MTNYVVEAAEQVAFIVSASGPYIHKAWRQMILCTKEEAEEWKEVADIRDTPGKHTVYKMLIRPFE